ncbi:uncharacterized protein STEHIDRAFT_111293 [Stereum hirsutum FP-91666 SS1]|uniref:uncharacterized protein n=1 Tax=Stereum hirsutum (strain FP-91666) TaxID=721885 RepID=UPI0004449683|nr:uncharacterized protein STEHIDRAFT_111293 [Stereum hirsutum FP-91666 SS1]EIM86887.1 hypothetical protein STEHIDRAFT_111293 [Stereum hirsutum FP-91666 SS1]
MSHARMVAQFFQTTLYARWITRAGRVYGHVRMILAHPGYTDPGLSGGTLCARAAELAIQLQEHAAGNTRTVEKSGPIMSKKSRARCKEIVAHRGSSIAYCRKAPERSFLSRRRFMNEQNREDKGGQQNDGPGRELNPGPPPNGENPKKESYY